MIEIVRTNLRLETLMAVERERERERESYSLFIEHKKSNGKLSEKIIRNINIKINKLKNRLKSIQKNVCF